MTRRLTCVGLLVLCLFGSPSWSTGADEVALVLVAGSKTRISRLSAHELRRVFLGLPVQVDGQNVRALLNTSDPLLTEIFLQKVVFMSARHYNRQLLSQTFRTGRRRPPRFKNREALVEALQSNRGAVAVIWEREAKEYDTIKIIQPIWRGRLR